MVLANGRVRGLQQSVYIPGTQISCCRVQMTNFLTPVPSVFFMVPSPLTTPPSTAISVAQPSFDVCGCMDWHAGALA